MAVINDLIERISDPELRRRISDEVARMQKQKKFGLVFEEHLPEATPLYDIPIKKKSLVSLKDRYFRNFYLVKDIDGDKLICAKGACFAESKGCVTKLNLFELLKQKLGWEEQKVKNPLRLLVV